jgi:hypothetical protein
MACRRIEIMFIDDEPTGRVSVVVNGQSCHPSLWLNAAEFNVNRDRFQQLFQEVFERGIAVGTSNTQRCIRDALGMKMAAIQGERFCQYCKTSKIAEMQEADFLQRLEKQTMSPGGAEFLSQTKRGID